MQISKVEPISQYYGIGAVLTVGVIGGLGYYLYRAKKAQQPSHLQRDNPPKANQPPQQQAIRPPHPQTNKSEMD